MTHPGTFAGRLTEVLTAPRRADRRAKRTLATAPLIQTRHTGETS
jgi:hypothetical protein